MHDPNDADDLVQDCLERAIGRRHLWYGGATLRPWLFRIMHNLYSNQRRHRRAQPTPEPIDATTKGGAADEAQTARVSLREMQAALAALREEQRQVVVMVALSGMSYQECAAALGVPIGTVMSRLARGRENLRHMLEGDMVSRTRRFCGG